MKGIRAGIILLLLLLTGGKSFCTDFFKNHTFIFQPGYYTGFITDPNVAYQHLINGYIKAYHVNIGLQTKGGQPWHKYYRYPETGFTYIYYNLGNNEELGKVNGIIPFIKFKPLSFNKIFPSLYTGIGISYFNRPFDRLGNYRNVLIGSHLNAVLSGGIDLNIKLREDFYFNIGASFIHFSNGSTKLPNDGINIAAINAGCKYVINEKPEMENNNIEFTKIHFSFTPAISVTNRKNGLFPGFHYYDYLFGLTWQVNAVYAVGAGFDITYNDSDTTDAYYQKYIPGRKIQKGIKLINQFSFSKLRVSFNIGHELNEKDLYNWIILRYRIYRFIDASMNYKSYFLKGGGSHLSWGLCFNI